MCGITCRFFSTWKKPSRCLSIPNETCVTKKNNNINVLVSNEDSDVSLKRSFLFATFREFSWILLKSICEAWLQKCYYCRNSPRFYALGIGMQMQDSVSFRCASEVAHHILGSVYKIIFTVIVCHVRFSLRGFVWNRLSIGTMFKFAIRSLSQPQ